MTLRLAPWVRAWCWVLAVGASVIGANLVTDPRPFRVAVYDSAKHIAPLQMWGVAWWIVAAAALVAACSGHRWAWRVAAIGAMGTATSWAALLRWGRLVEQETVSWAGIALWLTLVGWQAVAMTARGQVEAAT